MIPKFRLPISQSKIPYIPLKEKIIYVTYKKCNHILLTCESLELFAYHLHSLPLAEFMVVFIEMINLGIMPLGLFLCQMAGALICDKSGFHAAAVNQELLDILEKIND